MTRSVPEWIARSDDDTIPHRVRMRIWQRDYGRCQKCEHKILPGDRWQCDHIIALVNGGKHQESNLQILCDLCHKKKTRADVREKSKIARVRAKHIGLKKPRKIRAWRNFAGDIIIMPRERR